MDTALLLRVWATSRFYKKGEFNAMPDELKDIKKIKKKRKGVERLEVFKTLDEGFQVFRKRYVKFIAIAAIVLIPLNLLEAIITYNLSAPYDIHSALPLAGIGLISLFASIMIGLLSSGAQMHLAAKEYLNEGEGLKIRDSLKVVLPKLLALILSSVLVGLFSIIGFVFFILPGVWFMMACSLTTAAIVIENKGPTSAIGRSMNLTRGNILRLIGAGIILLLIQEVASIPIHFINNFLLGAVFISLNVSVFSAYMFSEMFGILPQILVSPIATVVMAVVYFKLRDLHEGFDLERMVDKLHTDVADDGYNITSTGESDAVSDGDDDDL